MSDNTELGSGQAPPGLPIGARQRERDGVVVSDRSVAQLQPGDLGRG